MKTLFTKKLDTKELAEKKANDASSVTLTEDEVSQFKELVPVLIEVLPKLSALADYDIEAMFPKIQALLDGEVEIEIIDSDEEAEIETDEETEISDIEDIPNEEDVEEEDIPAEDNASTFNADEVLNDPVKKAAIEEALKKKAGDESTNTETEVKPAAKKFIKKTLTKKAGDAKVEDTKDTKKPNAEIVNTPVVRKAEDNATQTTKRFDFHRTDRKY